MKIENYQMSMNTNYFNLAFNQTDATISSNTSTTSNDTANELSKIQQDKKDVNESHDELSKELSKALLSNVNNTTLKIKHDAIELLTTSIEAEGLNFQAKAMVQTEGREIEFSLDISLSRSFVQKTSINLTAIEEELLMDPLVISLDGTMPSISSKTFSFDIDSDGKPDQISQLNRNSAFLALDKNNNGTVDNGNELFGTKSGNGFADLRAYDDDKNGWIDENDAIFNKLRVWQKDGINDKLIALGEVGIGAIYLGDTKTPFSLKSESNATLGQMRSSSVVLFEDGRASAISHIDFAVDKKTNENLDKLESASKKISALNLKDTYKSSSEDTGESMLQRLQARLSVLQSELSTAKDDEKGSIRASITAVQSQMMMLLDS